MIELQYLNYLIDKLEKKYPNDNIHLDSNNRITFSSYLTIEDECSEILNILGGSWKYKTFNVFQGVYNYYFICEDIKSDMRTHFLRALIK